MAARLKHIAKEQADKLKNNFKNNLTDNSDGKETFLEGSSKG